MHVSACDVSVYVMCVCGRCVCSAVCVVWGGDCGPFATAAAFLQSWLCPPRGGVRVLVGMTTPEVWAVDSRSQFPR